MPKTARFKSNIGSPVIDAEAGLIKGCRIATLGAVSQSKEDEGHGLVMDAKTITALFDLAQNAGGKIPAFFTHDWTESDKDPLNHDAGIWKDFAIQDGNLTATFEAFDTPYKGGIFSRAKADPNSIAVSPIFNYDSRDGSATLCTPTEFISSDFVKYGAINSALFKKQNKASMDIEDIITALKDPTTGPHLGAAIKAAMKSVSDSDDDASATAMEADAGVTDADKKDDDSKVPALMRAQLRIARVTNRVAKETNDSLANNEKAILDKAKVAAAAEMTAMLGKGGFVKPGEKGNDGLSATEKFNGAIKELTDKGVKHGAATLAVMKAHPELHKNMNVERGIFKN